MFKTLTGAALIFAGEAIAHSGHGAPEMHMHGWEYALLAALAACVIALAARR